MDTIYLFIIFAIGIIIAIGIGLEISKGIEETVIAVLFWFLYLITIITFINNNHVWFHCPKNSCE